jgi:transposase
MVDVIVERGAGLDVHEATIVASTLCSQPGGGRPAKAIRTFGTMREELAALVAWLEQLKPRAICLEATGGYERVLCTALHRRRLPVSVINPRQIRDFARSQGELAKTDAIDAAVIAHVAATFQPDPDEPPTPALERLRALRARRQQVVYSLTQEKNRLATAPDDEARESIKEAIGFYDRQLQELDRRIAELTAVDPAFRQRLALLVTVPGVGVVTAAGLIAELPELGTMNRGQAAKLVGLAPINRDSGTLRGKRMIGGGRAQVRRSLYMATIVATRHNQLIRSHYRQLLARGKTKMTALVACMRKLLLILNAIIKTNSPWNQTLTT